MSNSMAIILAGGILGIFLIMVSVAAFFISSVGFMKMFQKAGEAGWKAYIPFYNDYIKYKFSWNTKIFWITIALDVVYGITSSMDFFFFFIISLAAIIASLVLIVKLNIKIAKSFGKGAGWGLLLCIFPFIVSLILGFGDDRYIGNTTQNSNMQ